MIDFSDSIGVYVAVILFFIFGVFTIQQALEFDSSGYYKFLIITVYIIMSFPLAYQRKYNK